MKKTVEIPLELKIKQNDLQKKLVFSWTIYLLSIFMWFLFVLEVVGKMEEVG